MSRIIKVALTMEVKCEKECMALKAFKKACPGIPPDLCCLDCLLDEYIDREGDQSLVPEGVLATGFGRLTDISFVNDES